MRKPICALAGKECPRTSDTQAKFYCPAWVVGVPENERDGSGRLVAEHTYTGCLIPKLLPYMVGMTAEANQAHAAANQARDSAGEVKSHLIGSEAAIRGALIAPLMQSFGIGERVLRLEAGEMDNDI